MLNYQRVFVATKMVPSGNSRYGKPQCLTGKSPKMDHVPVRKLLVTEATPSETGRPPA